MNCEGTSYGAAAGVCNGVLVELFGHAFTDASRATRSPLSLYERMATRASQTRPDQGDLRALAPCPEVNTALGRLVAIIQGDYARNTDGIALTPEEDWSIRQRLVERIQSDVQLQARAHHLRSIAALAETAMEHHYSQQLRERLQRMRTAFALQPAGALRTHLLERCLGLFPYCRNYRLLTVAELRLLQQPAPPRLLRDAQIRELRGGDRERCERELSLLRSWSAARNPLPLHRLTFTVCGAGPLPVSGIMLHTLTDANVVLVEREPSAATASQGLISELERVRVLREGAVRVCQTDVAQLTFAPEKAADNVLLIASLVDAAGKAALANSLHAAARHAPAPTVLARSAGALCAELAYEPLDTLLISEICLPFCGEQAPLSQRGPSARVAAEQLLFSPREVLNSTELFRPLPLTAAQRAALGWLGALRARLRAEATLEPLDRHMSSRRAPMRSRTHPSTAALDSK